jgi:hypothetical protein
MNKKNAPGAIEMVSKGMAVMPMESKGGGVNLVGVLLSVEIRCVNRLGNRYGLNAG